MELTAVSFVVILFGTAWCWKDKPSDVGTTITLRSVDRMEDIITQVGIYIPDWSDWTNVVLGRTIARSAVLSNTPRLHQQRRNSVEPRMAILQ